MSTTKTKAKKTSVINLRLETGWVKEILDQAAEKWADTAYGVGKQAHAQTKRQLFIQHAVNMMTSGEVIGRCSGKLEDVRCTRNAGHQGEHVFISAGKKP